MLHYINNGSGKQLASVFFVGYLPASGTVASALVILAPLVYKIEDRIVLRWRCILARNDSNEWVAVFISQIAAANFSAGKIQAELSLMKWLDR